MWKPPIVVSTNTSVWRGESVQIPLRGFQANNPVEYSIDRGPRHGSLSPIRQPDPDRVAESTDGFVTYTHDDTDDNSSDEFTFRVRGIRGGGVSAPGTVRIEIKDRPPVLEAEASLHFEAVAGEIQVREWGVTNAGGSVLRGHLKLSAPFEAAGDGTFDLPRGTSTNIAIRYAPQAAGQTHREILRPALNDAGGLRLIIQGQSTAPFAVEVESDTLTLAGHVREGNIRLRNLSRSDQEILIAAPENLPLEIPPSIRLGPEASTNIVARIPEEARSGRLEIPLGFSTAFHREERVLIAPPVPAELAVLTPDLDFRTANEALLRVTNSGGVPASFYMDAVPGLVFPRGLSIDGKTFPVAPGEMEEVVLRLDLRRGQEPPTGVVVHLGPERVEQITVQAPESAGIVPEKPAVKPAPPPPVVPEFAWELNRDIRIKENAVVVLEWRTSQSGWRTPQLEVWSDGAFVPYRDTPPPRGFFGRIGDSLTGFLRNLVPEPPAPTTGLEDALPPEWTARTLEVLDTEITTLTWRLTAQKTSSGTRRAVTAEFRIDLAADRLVPASAPGPAATPATAAKVIPPPPPSLQLPATGTIPPALKIEDARMEAGRNTATVQLTIPKDPEADAYRLEHGVTHFQIDATTGIPHSPAFVVTPDPGEWQILGTRGLTHEGREMTMVVAKIEGLPTDHSSLWRLVTMGDGKDRWPTSEFIVSTLPPWQMPWRKILLGAGVAVTFVLLWVRWRSRRQS